jgi:hypothetical protein
MSSPYREDASSAPEWRPDRVITFAKYGPVWLAFVAALAIGLTGVFIGLASWTSLVCRRAADGSATCALVVKKALNEERTDVGLVDVQEAMIGEDGMRPCLRLDLAKGGTEWLQLGARNEAVASAVRSYRQSPSSAPLEVPLQSTSWALVALPITGVVLIGVVALAQTRTRIEVELETGKLRAVTKGWSGEKTATRDLDEIDQFMSDSESVDSNLSTIFCVRGEDKWPLGQAGDMRALEIARELESILAQRRKLVKRAKR